MVPGYRGQRVDIDVHRFAYDVATLWHIALILYGLSNIIIELLYPQRAFLQANIVHFHDMLTLACMVVSTHSM